MSIEDLWSSNIKAFEDSSNKIEALNQENDEGNDKHKLKLMSPLPRSFRISPRRCNSILMKVLVSVSIR